MVNVILWKVWFRHGTLVDMQDYTGQIKIEYVVLQDGEICIVPSVAEIRRTFESIGNRTVVRDADAGLDFKAIAQKYFDDCMEVRKSYADKIKVKAFDYRPYTHEDKLRARKCATTVNDPKDPSRNVFDQDVFEGNIMAFSTGMTYDSIVRLEEPIYVELAKVIFAKAAISADQLSFFDLSPSI